MSSLFRKTLVIVLAVILACYVLFAAKLYRPASDKVVSNNAVIVIEDSIAHPFVTSSEIRQLLKRNGLRLEGVPASALMLDSVERVVESHPIVRNAECCLLPSGRVKLIVTQRLPVIRLLPVWGGCHYLDEDGLPMDIDTRRTGVHVMDLPVATGMISMRDTVTLSKLYEMALQLHKSPYWNHLIQEIEVDIKGRWTFYPAEGDFDIRFGYPEDFSVKLGAIRSFYEKILPKVPEGYYSHINLEFKDQLICTRRKH